MVSCTFAKQILRHDSSQSFKKNYVLLSMSHVQQLLPHEWNTRASSAPLFPAWTKVDSLWPWNIGTLDWWPNRQPAWPTHSMDLNPCDFWVWGRLGDICSEHIANPLNLKTSFKCHIFNISHETLHAVVVQVIGQSRQWWRTACRACSCVITWWNYYVYYKFPDILRYPQYCSSSIDCPTRSFWNC